MGLRLIFFVALLFISLAAGVVDQRLFEGSVNLLNPAAALSTVVAFVALVLVDEKAERWKVEFVEASLASALTLHVLHLISLALVGVGIIPFVVGYTEVFKVKEVVTKPFKVSPFTITAKVIALDTVVLLILYYLVKFKKVRLEFPKRKTYKP